MKTFMKYYPFLEDVQNGLQDIVGNIGIHTHPKIQDIDNLWLIKWQISKLSSFFCHS